MVRKYYTYKRWVKKSKKRYSINNTIIKIYNISIFILFISTTIYTIFCIDKKIFPSVLAVASINMKTTVNDVINESLNDLINEMDLTAYNFYNKNGSNELNTNSLSINTVLINQLCSKLAVDISKKLNDTDVKKISIPLGSLLGVDMLSNLGPKYKVKVLFIGDTLVDYGSSFVAAGINQINFQIWVDIKSNMQVVNPLRKQEVPITRRVPLVNTIITGEVPYMYLQQGNNLNNEK